MNTAKNKFSTLLSRLDFMPLVLPFLSILALCCFFVLKPELSNSILASIRFFLGDKLGVFYIVMGLFVFLISIYFAFSKYGDIKLGNDEKPQYNFFTWGSMMFTAGLAADILFYSLCEWILYYKEKHIQNLGNVELWSSTYTLFHWGLIPWSFYLVLAVSFGFMLHVKKCNKQKFSEACRPILGKYTDGLLGRLIDLIAVFALIAGTATTFSLATPLLSGALSMIFSIEDGIHLSILLLIVICIIYSTCAYFGMNAISFLASSCSYLFFALLAYVFILGSSPLYILETGVKAILNLGLNFFKMASYLDVDKTTAFPQNWTIFYWAYWIVWCVATPFFIGSISRGRTIRQVIVGGYVFGISGTFLSFIILGNYGLGLQVMGKLDLVGIYESSGNIYHAIIAIFENLAFTKAGLFLLALSMIAFYATTFDSLALVAASYSYKSLEQNESPAKSIKLFWSILLILFPIALIFSRNTMSNLQTVSIIAAFPIGLIMLIIIFSFIKDANKYLSGELK